MTGDGRGGRLRRSWSDLPDDILDMVYRRCCSSPYDRTRFATVCSSWRAVAAWHPKLQALPLLLPSTGDAKRDRKARAYNLEEGRALRAPLRGFPWGKRIVGSHDGGWVAAVTGTRLLIVNVFSGARLALSARQSVIGRECPTKPQAFNQRSKYSAAETPIRKIIFSEDPSSSGCILAAMTTRCSGVALCRIGCPDRGWTIPKSTNADIYNELMDMAFCKGTLYGLTNHVLYKFVIGMNENGAPVVTLRHRIRIIETSVLRECWEKSHEKYIFELRGVLAIALRFSPRICCCNAHFFRVFELDDIEYKSREVTSLGDHALFLGPACCKAVHVPVIGERSKVDRNHIYYSKQQLCPRHNMKCLNKLDLGSYTLYCGKNVGMNPRQRIMSRGYHYGEEDSSNGCIWLLPPDL